MATTRDTNRDTSRAFNDMMVQFVSAMRDVFPDDIALAEAETALHEMLKTGPKLPIATWKRYVAKDYGEQIMNGDLTFFLRKDYTSEIRTSGTEYASYILETIDRLRAPLNRMSESSKQNAMEYMQNLTLLSQHYQVSQVPVSNPEQPPSSRNAN